MSSVQYVNITNATNIKHLPVLPCMFAICNLLYVQEKQTATTKTKNGCQFLKIVASGNLAAITVRPWDIVKKCFQ